MQHRTIHIAPAAPAKPALGLPCNGCGVCCLAEPCPLGMVLSRRRHGACTMLRWDAQALVYRCGALPETDGRWWQRLARFWVARWIGAGVGCDCDWTPGVASSAASPEAQHEAGHGPH